eukprot:m.18504 g.18504  ORF g.18504 m.18504 type:complete len:1164 (-) comp8321_c0_seq5:105-3596(-)
MSFVVFVAVVSVIALSFATRVISGGDVDIAGCQGTVSSPIKIPLEDVEIILKQHDVEVQRTEVSPHDGYFFLPLDTKGQYSVEVQAPSNWNFVPHSVSVSFDGETDMCSLGEDVTFAFVGLNVTGQVRVEGTNQGPSSVDVGLFSEEDNEERVAVATTSESGAFLFPHILPGQYVVRALETAWSFSKSSEHVEVNFESATAASLIISGYDITVSVLNDGSVTEGVMVFISSEEDHDPCPHIQRSPQPQMNGGDGIWCSEASDANGVVTFRGVNPGNHTIIPLYMDAQGEKYDITPSSIDVEVLHENLQVSTPFTVVGVYVTVQVMSETGLPLPGAAVSIATLKDEDVMDAVSDNNGIASFSHVVSGNYKIAVVHGDDVEFHIQRVTVGTSSHHFEISPSLVKVCGHLKRGAIAMGEDIDVENIRVHARVDDDAQASTSTETDTNGNFCFMFSPGSFVTIALEKTSAVYWTPSQLSANALSFHSGETQLSFNQALGEINGVISCLDVCPQDLLVSLSMPSDTSSPAVKKKFDAVVNDEGNAVFSVSSLSLQQYVVSVSKSEWCFGPKSVEVIVTPDHMSIDGSPHSSIQFSQKGFSLHIIASQEMDVAIEHEDGEEVVPISKGKSRLCLQSKGTYTITPRTSYRLEKDSYVFNTDSPQPIVLNVESIEYVGHVLLPSTCPAMSIRINTIERHEGEDTNHAPTKQQADESLQLLSPTFHGGKDGMFNYSFPVVVPRDKSVTVSVLGCTDLYVSPHEITVAFPTIASGVPSTNVTFIGREGTKLVVFTEPPIEGAEVTLYLECVNAEEEPSQFQGVTNEQGLAEFRVLDDDCTTSASISKTGYSFAVDRDNNLMFYATQLSSLEIITEYANGIAAVDVVVTVSGGSYRKTRASDENGLVSFTKLEPTQYFVKPLYKEHVLEPASQSVDIAPGEHKTINFIAKRTSFSAHGVVSTLGGGSLANAKLTLSSLEGEDELHTLTGDDGEFRFSGLKPFSSYVVRCDVSVQTHVFQPLEVSFKVEEEDVVDISFVATKNTKQCEISGRLNPPTGVSLSSIRVEVVEPETGVAVVSTRPFPGNYFEFRSLPQQQYATPLVVRASTHNWFSQQSVNGCSSLEHVHLNEGTMTEVVSDEAEEGSLFSLGDIVPAFLAAIMLCLFAMNAQILGLR